MRLSGLAACLLLSGLVSAADDKGVAIPGATTCGEIPAGDRDPDDLDDRARRMQDSGTKKFWSGFQRRNPGEIADGVGEVESAVKIDPRMPGAYSILATYYGITKKDPRTALRWLKTGLQQNPNSTTIHVGLGNVYDTMGEWQLAVEHFSKALDLGAPCRDSVLFNLGNAYSGLGRREMAIAQFRRALEVNPRFLKAYRNLIIAYYKEGNLTDARSEARRLVELDPGGEAGNWAREALRRMGGP